MTDNVTANAGAGGPVFKTDEVGGVHTPITKLAFGVDGTITTVDGVNPLPVTGAISTGGLTDAQMRASDVKVSLDGEQVSVSNFPATQAVTGTFWQTTQPVSGTFWQATQPVSGTFWQATQPVSGTVTANTGLSQPLTDTQMRASDVKVSLDGEQVSVSNFPATQAVTGTFWQATQPVSGTVTANTGLAQPLTDAQLRAAAVPVSGAFYQATQPVSATELPLPAGAATSTKQDETLSALHGTLETSGISDWIARRLLRALSHFSYDSSSQLRVTPATHNISTVTTLSTGNIGFGDIGKASTAMMTSRMLSSGNTKRNIVRT